MVTHRARFLLAVLVVATVSCVVILGTRRCGGWPATVDPTAVGRELHDAVAAARVSDEEDVATSRRQDLEESADRSASRLVLRGQLGSWDLAVECDGRPVTAVRTDRRVGVYRVEAPSDREASEWLWRVAFGRTTLEVVASERTVAVDGLRIEEIEVLIAGVQTPVAGGKVGIQPRRLLRSPYPGRDFGLSVVGGEASVTFDFAVHAIDDPILRVPYLAGCRALVSATAPDLRFEPDSKVLTAPATITFAATQRPRIDVWSLPRDVRKLIVYPGDPTVEALGERFENPCMIVDGAEFTDHVAIRREFSEEIRPGVEYRLVLVGPSVRFVDVSTDRTGNASVDARSARVVEGRRGIVDRDRDVEAIWLERETRWTPCSTDWMGTSCQWIGKYSLDQGTLTIIDLHDVWRRGLLKWADGEVVSLRPVGGSGLEVAPLRQRPVSIDWGRADVDLPEGSLRWQLLLPGEIVLEEGETTGREARTRTWKAPAGVDVRIRLAWFEGTGDDRQYRVPIFDTQ